MRNDTPRQIVRSRTTMGHAFDAAVQTVVNGLVNDPESVSVQSCAMAQMVHAESLRDRGRKTPTWTVSKKERRR